MSPRTPHQIVRLFHFTPRENVAKILNSGLVPFSSRIFSEEIWLCSWSRRTWARSRVAEWHDCKPEQLVELHVTVSAELLTRIRPGIYIVTGDIPADQIQIAK